MLELEEYLEILMFCFFVFHDSELVFKLATKMTCVNSTLKEIWRSFILDIFILHNYDYYNDNNYDYNYNNNYDYNYDYNYDNNYNNNYNNNYDYYYD